MKKAQTWIAIASVGTTMAFISGCGADAKPEPKSAQSEHISTTQPTSAAVPTNKKSDQTINVSDEIRKACGIDDSERAPKFDFDS